MNLSHDHLAHILPAIRRSAPVCATACITASATTTTTTTTTTTITTVERVPARD
ncbi:hypothetical protein [Dokdonella soli]|uniref:hypothetical protein n=1 Tax=Dokdonella soli TaxID=529810 RepID=UPI0031D83F6B